jgi:hypothetical protein
VVGVALTQPHRRFRKELVADRVKAPRRPQVRLEYLRILRCGNGCFSSWCSSSRSLTHGGGGRRRLSGSSLFARHLRAHSTLLPLFLTFITETEEELFLPAMSLSVERLSIALGATLHGSCAPVPFSHPAVPPQTMR